MRFYRRSDLGERRNGIFVRRIFPGEIIPSWMGIAYDRPFRERVCVLLPFNWPVWACRRVYWFFWLCLARTPNDWFNRQVEAARDRGYRDGLEARLRDVTGAELMEENRRRIGQWGKVG